MIKLQFKDKTTAECELLGRTEHGGVKYAVFFEPVSKDIYVYRYKQKRFKYKLFPIKDRNEFKGVCTALGKLIKKEEK